MGRTIETLTINIGKNGLSSNILDEIKSTIKKYKTIKLKFLQSAEERNNMNSAAKKITDNISCKILKKIGFSITIEKI